MPFLPFRSPFSPFLSPDGLVWTLQCQKWELLPRARRQCLPIGASQLCRISFSRRSPHSTSATLPSKKNFSKQALLLLHLRTFHFLLLTLQKTMKVAALIALVALALASFASGEYLKPFFWKEEIASRANPGRCFFFFFCASRRESVGRWTILKKGTACRRPPLAWLARSFFSSLTRTSSLDGDRSHRRGIGARTRRSLEEKAAAFCSSHQERQEKRSRRRQSKGRRHPPLVSSSAKPPLSSSSSLPVPF